MAIGIFDGAAIHTLLSHAEDENRSIEDTAMAGKIAALLNTLTLPDVEALAPAERRSFAERCRFWAYFAERTRIELQGGILAELREGYRID